MSLDNIVTVNIKLETQGIERTGFGIPMLVGEHTDFAARSKSYSDIESVAADFATTDPLYKMAEVAFGQDISPTSIKIGRKDSGETYTDALNAIFAEDDEWYGLAIESVLDADILLAAAFIETKNKIFVARSADTTIPDSNETGDIASQLQDLSRFRTIMMYHTKAATEYIDAAFLGQQLPTDPGSTTWKFKALSGVTVDALTTANSNNAKAKNANTYERYAGRNITAEGKVSGGEFIDVIRGRDWLQARIQEDIFLRLANSGKIPYTDKGIAVIENLLRKRLEDAVDIGFLDIGYTVTVPKVSDTLEADRAARTLRDVNFNGRVQGAIHAVTINGTLTA